jgi:hypothetical protein
MSADSLRRETVFAAAGAGLVHAAVAVAAILAGIEGTYAWHDEVKYHLPTIEKFAAELPATVLSDYQSATAPGYHLVMAAAMRVGIDGVPLHLLTAAFGALLAALFAALVARRAGGLVGLLAGCTLALSPYTVNPSVFLATDNVATLLLLGAFAFARPIATGCAVMPWRRAIPAAATAMLTAGVRQIMAYSAAFTGAAFVARACAERRWPRMGELVGSALALVPALLVVALFVRTWGGLVPPSFQQYHGSGGNPATPVYALALVSVWGGAAFLAIPGFLREFLSRRALLVGVLAALACCAVPSSYLVHVRFGGTLWTIASRFPEVADRSLLLVPMAGIGAALLGAYLRMWSRSTDTMSRGLGVFALLCFAGMVAAQTANSQCFERYLQPLTLVFTTVAAGALAGRNARWWPFAATALASAAWTALSLLKGGS